MKTRPYFKISLHNGIDEALQSFTVREALSTSVIVLHTDKISMLIVFLIIVAEFSIQQVGNTALVYLQNSLQPF